MPFLSITDFFSFSFIISLGITLLLGGFLYVYINQKMVDQNHKISSMIGLISTMAEEMNFYRAKIALLSSTKDSNLGIVGGGKPNKIIEISESKIEVSDDEDDEDLEDGDDEDLEDGDDDLEDGDDDLEDEDLEDEDLDADSDAELESADLADVKGESIKLKLKLNTGIRSINLGNNLNNSLGTEIKADDLIECEDVNDDEELNDFDLEELDANSVEDVIPLEMKANLTPSIDFTNLKTINISDLDNTTLVADYNKLSLNKLRSIVIEKCLSKDANKLKKPDLLKLLGVE